MNRARKLDLRKVRANCDDVAALLKALSHPERLVILCQLSMGEKCVNELVDNCEISQSQVSQFLIRLKAEGLVTSRREGTQQYYSVSDERVHRLLKFLHAEFC